MYQDQNGEFAFLVPILVYTTPSIIAAGIFIATHPALVGMIGNAFANRPMESSIRSTPVLGDIIDAKEAISGKDTFSGNSLSWTDRAISGYAATVPFVAGGMMRKQNYGSKAIPNLENLSQKITKQMDQQGWTSESIKEAFDNGKQIPAMNKTNNSPTTRYVNPTTGQSVVIENKTGEVIHVGGQGFKYGPSSGDIKK